MPSLTEQMIVAFLSCKLPREEWTHEAHLKVGLWHLLYYSPEESLIKLRQSIKKYNLACEIENTEEQGYHETITQFYVWLIERFIQETDCSQPIDVLADELIRCYCYGDKKILFCYYSRDRLFSKAARLSWVKPDLQPLR
ncbi:MAG TPA: hypothetical protein ACFCUY_05470 [Xenococcaceae cyanobacterium]|jgi:hypothetical protein